MHRRRATQTILAALFPVLLASTSFSWADSSTHTTREMHVYNYPLWVSYNGTAYTIDNLGGPPSTAVNGESTRDGSIRNQSSQPVTLPTNVLTLSGPDATQFQIRNDTCSGIELPPGGYCDFTFVFKPTSAGTKAVTLVVAAAGGATEAAKVITSVAVASGINAALTYDPGLVTIPGTAVFSLQIQSTGQAPLDVKTIEVTGTYASDYLVDDAMPPHGIHCLGKLPQLPGGATSCLQNIFFTPQGPGDRPAVVEITSSATDTPVQVPITGQGRENEIVVTADTSGITASWQTVSGADGYVAEATVTPPAAASSVQAAKKQPKSKKRPKAKKRSIKVTANKATLAMKIAPKSKYRVCMNAFAPNMRTVLVCKSGKVKAKRKRNS